MNRKHSLLTILCFFISNIFLSQKLMLSIDNQSAKIVKLMKYKNIDNFVIIYGKDIYPYKYNLVDENILKNAIIKSIPDENQFGYAALDWEGKALHHLIYLEPNSVDYKIALKQFKKALIIAKKLRPNIKWGYFNIPFRPILLKDNKDWNNANNNLDPLLREVDAFYPVFYPRTLNHSIDSIFISNLKLLKSKYQKPLVGFVWNRVEGVSNRYELVNKDVFIHTTRSLIKNDFMDKVVWWSQDLYFYRHNNKVFLKEAKSIKNFTLQYDKRIIEYVNGILK